MRKEDMGCFFREIEMKIQFMEAIDALRGIKTLIIIAHRLTTIRKYDKIFEIKGGQARLVDKEQIFKADLFVCE